MAHEGFPPKRRLRARRDFRETFTHGRIVHTGNLSMVFRQNDLGLSRLGITIRKTVCNAARRNRLKRWIREIFRKDPLLHSLALDVVVVVKKAGQDLRFVEIQEEFGRLLRKVL